MVELSLEIVKNTIASSEVVYSRGENIFFLGNYSLVSEDFERGDYSYAISGSYGDYAVSVALKADRIESRCSCPFPHDGCKHIVAACLDIAHVPCEFDGSL